MPTAGCTLAHSSYWTSPVHVANSTNGELGIRTFLVFPRSVPGSPVNATVGFAPLKIGSSFGERLLKCVSNESQGYSPADEEEDDLCPVECVREFKTDEEFTGILEKAKKKNSLVVVDFYRTSCGSCKYIEQGFSKLCKASGDEDVPVIFLKHNVIDEYDEQSEVAERLRIKTVPLFHFYKNGTLLEAFPTRDKERVTEAIYKYMSPATQDSLN